MDQRFFQFHLLLVYQSTLIIFRRGPISAAFSAYESDEGGPKCADTEECEDGEGDADGSKTMQLVDFF